MSVTHRMQVEVRSLLIEDAPTCDQIILTLPRHFGYERGRQACAQAVRTSEGWVAISDGRVVGFLTVQPHGATSVEITWMTVREIVAVKASDGGSLSGCVKRRKRRDTASCWCRPWHPPMREILGVRPKRATLRRRLSGRLRSSSVLGSGQRSRPAAGHASLNVRLCADAPARLIPKRGACADAGVEILPDGPCPPMSAFSDLNLLLEFGGRLRSEVEFRALLQSAGFTARHLVREPDAHLVILEAWPVSSTEER